MKYLAKLLFALSISISQFSYSKEIKIRLENWIDDTVPTTTVAIEGNIIANQVFETLMTMSPSGEYIPQLAESWSFDSSGRVLKVKINKSAKFSDGTPINSDHVLFMIKSALKAEIVQSLPKIIGARDFMRNNKSTIKGFEKIDDLTFTLKFMVPNYAIVRDLADIHCGIFKPMDSSTSVLGTGPFVIEKIEKEKRQVLLIPNKNYWKNQQATNTFLLGSDSNFIGDISIAAEEPSVNSKYQRLEYFDSETYLMGLNSGNPLLQKRIVRQFISSLVTKAELKEVLGIDPSEGGLIPIGIAGYSKMTARKELSESDKTEALKAIRKKQISILTYQPRIKKIANLYCSKLKSIGADCKLEEVTFPDLFTARNKGTLQIFFARLKPTIPDAEDLLGIFASGSFMNIFLSANQGSLQKEIDTLFTKLQNLPLSSQDIRVNLIKQIDSLVFQESLIQPFFYGARKYIYLNKNITIPPLSTLGPIGIKFTEIKIN